MVLVFGGCEKRQFTSGTTTDLPSRDLSMETQVRAMLHREVPVGLPAKEVIAKFGSPNSVYQRDEHTLIYTYNWPGAELLIDLPNKVVGISIGVEDDKVIRASPITMRVGRE